MASNIIDLQAQARTDNGTAAVKRLRKAGNIPGVVYGRGIKNSQIQLDSRTFTRIIDSSASDNILVNLQVGGATQLALVQEVQHDHLKGGIIHVDFHAIKPDEEIHAEVPLELIGAAVGVKAGGEMDHLLHSITVYCKPGDLPVKMQADVTNLEMGKAIHVREITLPAGVTVRLDGNVVVALIHEPKVDDSPAAVAKAAAPKGKAAPAAKK